MYYIYDLKRTHQSEQYQKISDNCESFAQLTPNQILSHNKCIWFYLFCAPKISLSNDFNKLEFEGQHIKRAISGPSAAAPDLAHSVGGSDLHLWARRKLRKCRTSGNLFWKLTGFKWLLLCLVRAERQALHIIKLKAPALSLARGIFLHLKIINLTFKPERLTSEDACFPLREEPSS